MSIHWPFSGSLLAITVIVFGSCASPKSPTGGPKDIAPPEIIKEESTPNHQTFFKEKEIIITFDEWITLKDVYNQLVVSPLMPHDPEIKQKGKSLVISLPDSLKEETTYTINFGNAIADNNEGNVLENFAFVFSTGAVLDSNKLSGTVIDAITLKPAPGIWVMLYPVDEDSAVYKRKPEYLAKSDKEGKWIMANIRTDSFQVVALKEDNLNFLYDQDGELFGWLDEIIYTDEPYTIVPEIVIFPREKRTAIREVLHPFPGWMKIIEDGPIPKPMPKLIPPLENALNSWDGDTLHIWYPADKNYAGYAILGEDTTKIRVSPGHAATNSKLTISSLSGRIDPSSAAKFATQVPISTIDTSRIKLAHDSLGSIPFTLRKDSILMRRMMIKAAWVAPSRYSLTFLPGAVTDFWGRTNDTIRQSIVVLGGDQFGELTLNVEGLDSTKQYMLFIKAGEQILDRFVIEHLAATQIKKASLSPGKYGIEIIEDTNENGVWDTGDYAQRRQPERKLLFTLENLRAGWELESFLIWE